MKLSAQSKADKRQAILDAALRCFSRDGFHATTTGDIVREAGVSQGALYLYFRSKDELILALADDRRRSDALIAVLVAHEDDPLRGVTELMELYGRSLIDPQTREIRRVAVQGWAEALRSEAIRDQTLRAIAEVRGLIVETIRKGQESGLFRAEVSAAALADILIAAFNGLTLRTAWGEALDLEPVGQTLAEMIRRLLLPS